MTTRYQTEHYEDMARTIRTSTKCLCRLFEQDGIFATDRFDRCDVATAFADLFAADNPPFCAPCQVKLNVPTWETCAAFGHPQTGGFDPAAFLKACGLEETS